MLACVDVDYRSEVVVGACAVISTWSDAVPLRELTVRSTRPPAAYVPGELFRRELPYILEVLGALELSPKVIVVDGFVWLGSGRPGLGAHLYEALERRCAVVGVAKSSFLGASGAVPVVRGRSKQPLFVTAAGMDIEAAARGVLAMHGPHRIPTILKRVDHLARRG
ncbi:MAG: endonuclease V [Myxococcaceae bacterium]